jgi:hypothetical protein
LQSGPTSLAQSLASFVETAFVVAQCSREPDW